MMTASGIKNMILTTMDKGIYEFCGFKVQHHFFYAVPFVTDDIRKEYLKKIKEYLSE
jgi:NAD(P)H dehydrogenase (quinone)